MSKLPYDIMQKYIFNRKGVEDPDVLCGPAMGEDAAVIRIGSRVAAVHADPIVGAIRKIGWLSVHIACNDIAVQGVPPRWIVPVIILPEKHREELIDEITSDIHSAAREISVAVVGGHIGYAAGLDRPLIATTAFGEAAEEEVVYTRGARPGDLVCVTKGAGIEGSAIIAFDFTELLHDHGIPESVIERAQSMMSEISVVREALALRDHGATAMHDATRGGVMEAMIETALSSRVKFEIEEDKIPVRRETRILAKKIDFDPLWLIGSGSVIATIPEAAADQTIETFQRLGTEFAIIGKAVPGCGVALHRSHGGVEKFDAPRMEEDELARLWKLYK